ncbi:MAG: PilZ domain protein [Gemmataceae bacterium]|nr:PilZ domain protein [Gemmataceae bacterium]
MPPDITPLHLAGAAAGAALLAVLLRPGPRPARTLREKVGAHAGGALDEEIDRMLNWLPRDAAWSDRRRAVRRAGRPTPVRVAPAPVADARAAEEGLVLDRSTAGLCVAVHRPLAEGGRVFFRAEADGAPWVGATVRQCRTGDDFYLIGCQFHETPPWAVLLLFG